MLLCEMAVIDQQGDACVHLGSDETVRKRRAALERKEQEAEQKHAELLTTRHANEKARLDAQMQRENATMRLAHIKAEQEIAARKSYYQVSLWPPQQQPQVCSLQLAACSRTFLKYCKS